MDDARARACLAAAGDPGRWSGSREVPAEPGDAPAEAITVTYGIGTDCIEARVATWSWRAKLADAFAYEDREGASAVERFEKAGQSSRELPARSVLMSRFILRAGDRYTRFAYPPSRSPSLSADEKAVLVSAARAVAARGPGLHVVEGQPALGEVALVHAPGRDETEVAFFSARRENVRRFMVGRDVREFELRQLSPGHADRFADATLLEVYRFSASDHEFAKPGFADLTLSGHHRVWQPA